MTIGMEWHKARGQESLWHLVRDDAPERDGKSLFPDAMPDRKVLSVCGRWMYDDGTQFEFNKHDVPPGGYVCPKCERIWKEQHA